MSNLPSHLFGREMTLTVGGLRIPLQAPDMLLPNAAVNSLRCIFSVEKTSAPDPNKASVTVYNLNPMNRATISASASAPPSANLLMIEAGYKGMVQKLFLGEIKKADSRLEGVDWITTVEAEDSGPMAAYNTRRVTLTLGPGTTVAALLTAVTGFLGVGVGNSVAGFSAPLRDFVVFKKGVSVDGTAADILNTYVPALGKRWSIQDGMLQVLGPQESFTVQAVLLNQGSGLIGVPELGEKGAVTFRSLLQGSIMPGGYVRIDCTNLKGNFKCEKVHHFGDTHGTDWYSDGEAEPVTPI